MEIVKSTALLIAAVVSGFYLSSFLLEKNVCQFSTYSSPAHTRSARKNTTVKCIKKIFNELVNLLLKVRASVLTATDFLGQKSATIECRYSEYISCRFNEEEKKL